MVLAQEGCGRSSFNGDQASVRSNSNVQLPFDVSIRNFKNLKNSLKVTASLAHEKWWLRRLLSFGYFRGYVSLRDEGNHDSIHPT